MELLKEAELTEKRFAPRAPAGKNPTVKNFEAFWKPFRAALLASDMDALAKMTMFPVRAYSDTDPDRDVDRAEFPRLMRRLMAQDIGRSDGHESHVELAKRLPRIVPDWVQGPTARVGDLQFWYEPSGWRFESAWINDIDESQ